jgi:hypothetical protein
MRRISLICLALSLLFASSGQSQEKYKLGLQIRYRFEIDNKDFSGETAPNDFNLLRTRLAVTLTPSADLEGFVQVQDARVFGEETSTLTDGSADNLDLHQAYFQIKNLCKLPVDLKAGRMEVTYGSERFIGAVGWSNIGRSFDGGILRLRQDRSTLDIFNLKEVELLQTGDAGDRNVIGFNADLKLFQAQTTQVFLLWQRMQPTEQLNRFTPGIYLSGKEGDFRHTVELAYQFGKVAGMDVAAYLFAVDLGYAFRQTRLQPDFSAGVDFLSGDDDPEKGDYKVFDTMYATGHKFYGYMDYFTNIPAHTYGLGLLDLHVGLTVKPCEKSAVNVVYHHFAANQDFTLSDGSTSRSFGDEVDLTANHNYNEFLTLTLGASLFAPGEIFKQTKGEDTSTWFYLMALVNL